MNEPARITDVNRHALNLRMLVHPLTGIRDLHSGEAGDLLAAADEIDRLVVEIARLEDERRSLSLQLDLLWAQL